MACFGYVGLVQRPSENPACEVTCEHHALGPKFVSSAFAVNRRPRCEKESGFAACELPP